MDKEKEFRLKVLNDRVELDKFVEKLRANKCFGHFTQPMRVDEKTLEEKICVIYLHHCEL